MKYSLSILKSTVVFTIFIICHGAASALSMQDSIVMMLNHNSQLGEAIENYNSVHFELQQARGLSGSRVDLKAIVDPLNNSDATHTSSVSLAAVLRQPLFDSFRNRANIQHHEARLAGADARVLERSELLSLHTVRDYIQIVQQQQVVSLVQENIAFHKKLEQQIRAGVIGGTLTEVDILQARASTQSAEIRLIESKEDLVAAQNSFIRLVGQPVGQVSPVAVLTRYLPNSVNEAIARARINNPSMHSVQSDVSAASSLVREARANMGPKLDLVARVNAPRFLDNANDNMTDGFGVYAELSWNLFDHGIALNKEREQVSRLSEQDMRLYSIFGQIKEDVRISWDHRESQSQLLPRLRAQSVSAHALFTLYLEQFTVGRRSLLDVLKAQDSKLQSDLLILSAKYGAIFAEYRLLALMGDLLASLDLSLPVQHTAP